MIKIICTKDCYNIILPFIGYKRSKMPYIKNGEFYYTINIEEFYDPNSDGKNVILYKTEDSDPVFAIPRESFNKYFSTILNNRNNLINKILS